MLDELRRKPKDVRNSYAFFGAATITAIIALIWLISVHTRLTNSGEVISVDDKTQGVFSEFFGQVKSNAANTLDGFKNGYESVTEEPASDPVRQEIAPTKPIDEQVSTEPTEAFGWSTNPTETVDQRRVIIIATSSENNTASEEE